MADWPTFLLVLLFVILGAGSNGVRAATDSALFEQAVAVVAACSSTAVIAEVKNSANNLECAMRCSLVPDASSKPCRSFSFADGVCVLSSSADCAAAGAAVIFKRRFESTSSDSNYAGFVQTVGARQFWVFQQRRAGSVNFQRNWTDYVRGFGDGVDFWSGLAAIQNFTGVAGRNLRAEMMTYDFAFYVSEWSNFTVAGPATNYTMSYGSYWTASSNTSGDSLFTHANMKFSTMDRDNDLAPTVSCAQVWGGGFWFNNCQHFNANGLYSSISQNRSQKYMSNLEVDNWKTLREMRLMLQV